MEFTPILPQKTTSKPDIDQYLLIRSANDYIAHARLKPIPCILFSEFWHQGELCILFADTNVGKSILSVQIANAISSGTPAKGFKMEAYAQVVLYFDFEMSDKQFEKRYSQHYSNHYRFDDRFLRIELNPELTDFEDFENRLFEVIRQSVQLYNAKVIIIDNLTSLKAQSTETSKEAMPLMKMLKELKHKFGLSILVLAHTPKRNPVNPITKNDLAGSKHIANFTDSIFAIGESHQDKSLRYIKQIKSRDTEIVYDSQNVLVCRLHQPSNFLFFEPIGFSLENEHLKVMDAQDSSELESANLELKTSHPNISGYEIAKRLNTYEMKVKRVLKKSGY